MDHAPNAPYAFGVARLIHLLLLLIAMAATAPAAGCGPGHAVPAIGANAGHHHPAKPIDHVPCKQALCCGLAELSDAIAIIAPIAWRRAGAAPPTVKRLTNRLHALDPPPPRIA